MKRIKAQAGWTFWSVLFIGSIVVFFSYVGMQLVPIYAVNANVKNAMELSLEGTDLRKATRQQIIRKLQAQLYLDGTDNVLDYKRDLKIKRSRSRFIIETSYEREVRLLSNVYLVVKFENVSERELRGG
ncbi:MAG: DUF4845 domain-containing protein [Pseudomonadota bacterium]